MTLVIDIENLLITEIFLSDVEEVEWIKVKYGYYTERSKFDKDYIIIDYREDPSSEVP